MISKRDLIKTIFIAGGNLEHIEKTKNINGTLLMEIERVMEHYKNEALTLTAVSHQREQLFRFANDWNNEGWHAEHILESDINRFIEKEPK
jgi:hypothetical protein